MRWLMLFSILFLIFAKTSVYSEVTNGMVTLRWTLPETNFDGTPLIDLVGAKIYYGTSSSNYTRIVDAGLTNSITITGLEANVLYFFNGTAYYRTIGLESDFCNEVAKLPHLGDVRFPTNLKIMK